MKNQFKLWLSASCVAVAVGMPAVAQEEDAEARQDTVVVTGSFIAGTPEDAALPVDVLTAGELKLEGSPSVSELIRNLGVSSGVDGQTNQFASNGLEGTSNVNLRGLGPGRTLVLLNGKRQTFSPYSVGEQAQLFVDTNMIPSAAIGRIEVLKDGAAALYGSDAIAGVVNFITRNDLDGFEVGGSFQQFDGSDGEYDVSAAWGKQGGDWNFIISAGYQYRNEVPLLEKDWAISDITENPVGGFSSLSNPGRYVALGATGVIGAVNREAGCTDVGGIVNPANDQCYFQFTQFDNLVEEEERYQIFAEFNREFGNGVGLHVEALYGMTDVPSWKTSPSYPPQELATQVVPVTNPGFQQYIADNPGDFPAGTLAALYIGRSFGWGGFPGTGGAQEGFREHETLRLAGELDGTFENGINWSASLGYSEASADRNTNDTYILGFTAALNGFGVCTDPITGNDPATGTQPFAAGYTGSLVAGTGACEYYNPFSNAIPANAITGEANPSYVPGLENSETLADWMTDGQFTAAETSLLVFDAVMNGQSNVQAAGGSVGWAAGFQVRQETYTLTPNALNNLNITPGPGGTGPFSFLAGFTPADRDQTIYAAFGELQIPLFEDLDVQVAMRYEDYGGDVGSTFDPKVAAKWQVNDAFSLRGSAQTSFKGPTLNQLAGNVTTLQFVAPISAFKAVDQFGNPALSPESAFSFNIGGIYQQGGFSASLDYYNFDFSDPIIVEDQASIVNAALAAIAAGDTDNAILERITFTDNNSDGINQANEIARVETNIVNGPDIKTSGFDIRVENVWDNAFAGGDFSLGAEASYILEYDVDDFEIEGVVIPGGDRVDQFNRSNFSRSLPSWKANVFANLSAGDHNFRGVMRHIDSYEDERGDLTGNGTSDIDSQTTFDLNYDPYTHNPFGRTFKISVTKRFGGSD
ncbi:TonB-dependent receptor plug domain-containing protein [Hyphomonas atlantica corrig.]|uniref:TonB-dependent receptor plug domain-containing protein n=1 Tax=Hyphomonas atlantica TaxID=1280948 RepID=UPI002352E98C|nr:TonB-dependent receptor [Hyphomonas atlantica]